MGVVCAMQEYSICGKTVAADLYGVDFNLINDKDFLVKLLTDAAVLCGANVLDSISWQFFPNGVTVANILSESHITCHSYPESGFIALDCYTCGTSCDPEIAIQYCIDKLNPTDGYDKEVIARGKRSL
jgi:S-adenosylmethionine decarboxylase